ncbi:hypothetical protein AGLY_013441 [Aphis glycines]|uniref:Uncharacterized protein n=1 Tax=Aphis glycines TaxID=307491 RepID=A0A6G0T765_APHGL|nr:hypothetical protein AGLY_013441 [Aphis glycines]
MEGRQDKYYFHCSVHKPNVYKETRDQSKVHKLSYPQSTYYKSSVMISPQNVIRTEGLTAKDLAGETNLNMAKHKKNVVYFEYEILNKTKIPEMDLPAVPKNCSYEYDKFKIAKIKGCFRDSGRNFMACTIETRMPITAGAVTNDLSDDCSCPSEQSSSPVAAVEYNDRTKNICIVLLNVFHVTLRDDDDGGGGGGDGGNVERYARKPRG